MNVLIIHIIHGALVTSFSVLEMHLHTCSPPPTETEAVHRCAGGKKRSTGLLHPEHFSGFKVRNRQT